MIGIYICEDEIAQLNLMEKQIKEFLLQKGLADKMQLVCGSQFPSKLMYGSDMGPALYFVDLDLDLDFINGIEVAVEIKKYNKDAFIVMMCYAKEFSMALLEESGAYNYLIKDNTEAFTRLRICLLEGYNLLLKSSLS